MEQRFRSFNLPLSTASPEAVDWMGKVWSDPQIKKIGKEYFHQATAMDSQTKVEHYDDVLKDVEGVTYGRFEEGWVFRS